MELQKEFPIPKKRVTIPALGGTLEMTGHTTRRVHFHTVDDLLLINKVQYNLRAFVSEVATFEERQEPGRHSNWQERPAFPHQPDWAWKVEQAEHLTRVGDMTVGTDAARKKMWNALSEWTSKFVRTAEGIQFLQATHGYLLEKELNRAACALEDLDERVQQVRKEKQAALTAYLDFAEAFGIEVLP